MNIEINFGHGLNGHEEMIRHTEAVVENILDRFTDHINRVEIHITDENNKKRGGRSKRCLIETRIKGHQSIAVTVEAESAGIAVSRAAEKLKRSLDHTLGRQGAHKGRKHLHGD
ncbi:MAG: hypothetical protein JW863_22250 [Chitinispirillaceae bacterium]|nr:hypothetical protein [Chitinispirillaceae bacterium]